MSSCCVCVQDFTKQPNRKQACCPFCDIKICVTCVQTYLLSTHEDAHCMNCRRGWTREVLDAICLTTWINGAYKKHRENQLLDRERSRLPVAQVIVEHRKKAQELEPERLALIEKMSALEKELSLYRYNFYEITRRIAVLTRGQDPDTARETYGSASTPQEERRVFVMPCPAASCRGFLSQAYKCGVCDTYVCPECREIKNGKDDPNHVCDASTVATVRALKKDTRPCPDCGTCIFKIEGCFVKDTPILLWNGTTKVSQDIVVGDELVGDDGKKRIVENVVTGEDNLYEIKQQNGTSYTVNSKHTLVLKYSGDKTIHHNKTENTYKIQWFSRQEMKGRSKKFNTYDEAETFRNETLTFTDEIEMTIEDYVKLDKWSKMYLMGYKSCNGITWQEQEVSLDPYMLGIWLGDGTACLPDIASNDIEIQDYILKWCQENDAELVHDEGVKFRIRRRNGTNHKGNARLAIGNGSNSNECKGCQTMPMKICNSPLHDMPLINSEKTTNPFTDYLKQYNLVNNKHIPKEYLMNSLLNRLKLLAGLIDTDGHVPKDQDGKRAIIIQSEGPLINDIVILCRSLGFVVNIRKTERKNVSIFGNVPKNYKDIYTINISGELLHEIPTLLPRKKCSASNPNKDYYRTSIDVSFKERGTYYGWSVDSNHRFLHEDFTVMRNCNQMFCTNCNTPFDWVSGKKITNGVIHNPHYFEYLRATNGGIMPRNPGDIPCGTNLPGAWSFEREVIRRYPHLAATTTDWLYKALQTIAHIQHAEIPNLANQAEDMDNTEYNVRYITKDITEARWKQLLQMREKRRLKRDEVRMRYEAFVGACVDIFGRLMEIARATPEATTGSPGSRREVIIDSKMQRENIAEAVRQAKEQMMGLRLIFNTGMMDISKRYKCQVMQLTEVGLKRETRKYEAGKAKPRRVKKSDGDTIGDSEEGADVDELGEDTSDDDVPPAQPKNELVRS